MAWGYWPSATKQDGRSWDLKHFCPKADCSEQPYASATTGERETVYVCARCGDRLVVRGATPEEGAFPRADTGE
jgi:predicted SprT family Zn-dependent metalloprotease